MKSGAVTKLEFKGGFALVAETELLSVIGGYRAGILKKDALRVFAARCELRALHPESKVDLKRVLNNRATSRGPGRLRAGRIKRAEESIKKALGEGDRGDSSRKRALPRVALRAIAQGRFTCSETIVFFMYCLRRIAQRKPLKRLLPEERYARFTYRELGSLSGMAKANISRAVSSLKAKGFLGNVWVVKPNENQFGLLFVDGHLLSLIPGAANDRSLSERKKSPTPREKIANTGMQKLPTLKNSYPKTINQKSKQSPFFVEKRDGESDWERILRRSKAIKENFADQAA